MIKHVIFDFDGTLTKKKGNFWREIWNRLQYSTDKNSYYYFLYKSFMEKKITHAEWCDLTLKAFNKRNFNKTIFDGLVRNVELMKNARELIEHLYKSGKKIHIVSGNIVDVIESVLHDSLVYIERISANDFVFGKNGELIKIVGTKYDYEGKAKYVEELCKTKNLKPEEICFVGNSVNDEYVYTAGVKTICINPTETNENDSKIWNKVIITDDLIDLENELL